MDRDLSDERRSSDSKGRTITDLVLYKHIVTTAHYNDKIGPDVWIVAVMGYVDVKTTDLRHEGQLILHLILEDSVFSTVFFFWICAELY